MPLTKTGKKVLSSMREQYGERGEEVFYRSINKGLPGSTKWHKKKDKKFYGHMMPQIHKEMHKSSGGDIMMP